MRDAADFLAEKLHEAETSIMVYKMSLKFWENESLRGKTGDEIQALYQKAASHNVYL